jgi:SulP family sulfate permease
LYYFFQKKFLKLFFFAIIVVFGLVLGLGIETKTVADIASISGGFPPFHIPNIPLNFETLQLIFPYALIMASVGLTEGLLTLNLVDEITGTKGKVIENVLPRKC